jgi:cytochrome c-type biogenesis protein CcmH/NrfG
VAAASVAIVAIALACVWGIWQPLRASNATAAAVSAFGRGDTSAAIADATRAAAEDPVSVDPLFQLAAVYTAIHQAAAARTELLRAVARQPENPQTWLMLGEFDLGEHHPRIALRSLERARQLDLGSAEIAQQIAQAERS